MPVNVHYLFQRFKVARFFFFVRKTLDAFQGQLPLMCLYCRLRGQAVWLLKVI